MLDTIKPTPHSEFSVSKFIQETLSYIVEANASDIHFEPTATELKIRYRRDGVFIDLPALPIGLSRKILAHLKSTAQLNVTENRKPQDGRMTLQIAGKTLNFRISTIPVQFGESLVLRILNPLSLPLRLEELGLNAELIEIIRRIVKRPYGIFIVTGPTGSGKTTTLYSLLQDIYTEKKKFLTVEDPVEYIIPGVTQVSTNNAVGLTFAKVLRSFLRHDPDLIMVGEIRDLETAQIAVQASLTGHTVLTTLHTNCAVSAIARLINLGLAPCLIANSLQGVIAQRLIRTFCNECSGNVCKKCNDTGYAGRTGIFEFLVISEALKQLIARNASYEVIEAQAKTDGLIKLHDSARNLVKLGKTSFCQIDKIL